MTYQYICRVGPLSIYLFLQEKLKLVSVLGAGLLVGTALAVIIPEGVHTLYMTENGKADLIYAYLCNDDIMAVIY